MSSGEWKWKKETIARALNAYFANICAKLAALITETSISFEAYLTKYKACLDETLLRGDEF